MKVRVKMQQFAERLDRGHHARHHVVAAEQVADFGLQAGPDARAQLAQQRAAGYPVLRVGAGMQPQTLGTGRQRLTVGDGVQHASATWIEVGAPGAPGRGPFLVAGRAGAALLTGKGHEHLVLAVRAADARKALVQIAALEEGLHGASTIGRQKPYLA